MPKISVIIPVYNVEEYLEKCLDSVINQTFKDIEIICINDGSTDNSLEILNTYIQKDSRIKLINQENKGLSHARNTGIEIATGEYISFIDSDDYISNDLYETLINLHTDADMICFNGKPCGNYNENFDKITKLLTCKFDGLKSVSDKTILKTNVHVWNKLFKNDVIKKHNIKFLNDILFEDFIFTIRYMSNIKKVYYLQNNQNYYFYRQNPKSIMHNCDSKAIHHLYAWFEIYNKCPKLKKSTLRFLFEDYFKLAYKLSNFEKRQQIIDTAKKYAKLINYKSIDKLIKIIVEDEIIYKNNFEKIFSLKNHLKNKIKSKTLTIFGFKILLSQKIIEKSKFLVAVHIFYHNQIDYICNKLKSINNCDWDLYVTYCEENQNSFDKIKSIKPDAKFIKTENVGYDIYPFIEVLNNVDLANYDYILKIHTKNTARKKAFKYGKGQEWRNLLISPLLKSKNIFRNNLTTLLSNPNIGMICAKPCLAPMGEKVNEDTILFNEFVQKYKLKITKGNFVSGTMFIAKAECFEQIKSLSLTASDFPNYSSTGSESTISHVLERVLTRIIEADGYKIHPINDWLFYFKRQLTNLSGNIFSVRNKIIDGKKHKYIILLGLKINL